MAFVYRYIDSRGTVRYIGRVFGPSSSRLQDRFCEHKDEIGFDPDWRVEYIDGLTDADADILETYFIAATPQSALKNGAKRWGPTAIKLGNLPKWKRYEGKAAAAIELQLTAGVQMPQPIPASKSLELFEPPTADTLAEYPAYVTIKKAAEISGVSEFQIRRRAKDGTIPRILAGRPGHGTYMINLRKMLDQFAREVQNG